LSKLGWPRPGLVLVGGPETGGIGREHFVNQHQLAVDQAKFELGVGDDEPRCNAYSAAKE
jgi:hypothetical protein